LACESQRTTITISTRCRACSSVSAFRFIRIEGQADRPGGTKDGFDLDAVGLINRVAPGDK
jgi:hypothetical protein